MDVDLGVLWESWALVPANDKVAGHFYGLLFTRYPQLRELFPPAMGAQRDRLVSALTHLVLNLDRGSDIDPYLEQLGRDHRKYGVRPEHYPMLRGCLIAALKENASGRWRPEYSAAWSAAFDRIAAVMIRAAGEAAVAAPPYWDARVVGHERRTDDIAVITVQPDQVYPYAAGQYLTLQTARWPRVWRPYSIANAPRPDNRLTLHVRRVPAGWVSSALVTHTAVGDRIRLGPPRGTMMAPRPAAEVGGATEVPEATKATKATEVPEVPEVLCAAGGTGLAPLKAIAEQVLRDAPGTAVTLVYGCRDRGELYDIDELVRMRAAHPTFRLVTALSAEPDTPPVTVADAVSELDPLGTPRAYVCGPDPMVETTCRRLRERGVPPELCQVEVETGPPAGGTRQAGARTTAATVTAASAAQPPATARRP